MNKFSPTEVIKSGWQSYKGSFGELWAIYLVAFFVGLVPVVVAVILSTLSLSLQGISWLINFIGLVFGMIVGLGLLKAQIDVVDGKKIQVSEVFSQWRKTLIYFVSSFLVGLVVAAGMMLLIVPGIIFATRLQFFNYLIVDKKFGPIAAIKESWAMTKGITWNLFIFGILLFMMNFVAAIFVFVGLVVTIPVSGLALTHVYRILSKAQTPEA